MQSVIFNGSLRSNHNKSIDLEMHNLNHDSDLQQYLIGRVGIEVAECCR